MVQGFGCRASGLWAIHIVCQASGKSLGVQLMSSFRVKLGLRVNGSRVRVSGFGSMGFRFGALG